MDQVKENRMTETEKALVAEIDNRKRLEKRLEKYETALRTEAHRRQSKGDDLRCSCWLCALLRTALEE